MFNEKRLNESALQMNKKWILAIGLLVVSIGITALFLRPNKGRPEMDEQVGDSTHASAENTQVELVSTVLMNTPWSRFRGPNGNGISDDSAVPTQWSDTNNLLWKTKLPGLGASSPVLTEQFVFVTAYSGYGESVQNAGDVNQLRRHVCCIDRQSGNILWTRTIDSQHREDPYQGMGLPEHGYATNTPVTDGQHVFAFLGKSGVIAFDLQGNELWRVSVGTESGNRGWGTAASLILYDNLVIVNAAEESQSLIALDKGSGKVVWETPAATLELCYSTPAIVNIDATRDELVLAVPGEIWGLNPRNGKLNWYIETSLTGNLSPSIIVDGTTVYAFGGYRSSGSLAVKAGGKGDVTKSNVLWTSRSSSYVATPVLLNQRLYWIDDHGMYFCANAEDGELVHRARIPEIDSGGRPVYASPIAIDGKIYVQTRSSGHFVIEPSDELRIIAHNRFESDSTIFNATPAVDSGQLFLRSDSYLYCIGGTAP